MSGANGHRHHMQSIVELPRIPTTLEHLLVWREQLLAPDANDEVHSRIRRWSLAIVTRGVLQLCGLNPPTIVDEALDASRDGTDAVTEALCKSMIIHATVTMKTARQDDRMAMFDAPCACPDDGHRAWYTMATPIRGMLAALTDEQAASMEPPAGMAMAVGLALDVLWQSGKIDDLEWMQRVWNYGLSMCCHVSYAHLQLMALRAVGVDPDAADDAGDSDEGGEHGGLILP